MLVDNGSIYTDDLADILKNYQVSFEKHTPDNLNLNRLDNFDAIIISGRKKNKPYINKINSKIIKHATKNDTKLLAICYGAEILALTLGGTIKRMQLPRRGEESITVTATNPISKGIMNVFESHRYEIAKLPKTLKPIAISTNDKKYEIIRYLDRNIFGTQFHPEMSRDGHGLIQRFCNL